MKKFAIIVAGGSGTRFGAATPKQFLMLHGSPVLMRTIDSFYNADNSVIIKVALPKAQIELWRSLCKQYTFTTPHSIIEGGETRFHSVKNCIDAILPEVCDNDLIAIHDGVRPLIDIATINRIYNVATDTGAVIPVIAVSDSIRRKKDDYTSEALDRNTLVAVQTPQIFKADILIAAYSQPFSDKFTDDASVVEAFGIKIALTHGDNRNIKITHPFDIAVAETILQYGESH